MNLYINHTELPAFIQDRFLICYSLIFSHWMTGGIYFLFEKPSELFYFVLKMDMKAEF